MPETVVSPVHEENDQTDSASYIEVDGDVHGIFWVTAPVAKDIKVAEDLTWICYSHVVM